MKDGPAGQFIHSCKAVSLQRGGILDSAGEL